MVDIFVTGDRAIGLNEHPNYVDLVSALNAAYIYGNRYAGTTVNVLLEAKVTHYVLFRDLAAVAEQTLSLWRSSV